MRTDTAVRIDLGEATLEADLTMPDGARGVVLFAHGSGSSRRSPRNRMVATRLNQRRFGTLLADLLTAEEGEHDARTGALRFDIPLLSRRMAGLTDWAGEDEATTGRPVGLFGASTGAAAALIAAAARPERVRAVVSRGGRPDLAGESLAKVRAPTLLLVGERDPQVITLNERAAGLLAAPHRIHVVGRATHLFEEPGALEEVADRAADWFEAYL